MNKITIETTDGVTMDDIHNIRKFLEDFFKIQLAVALKREEKRLLITLEE